VNVGVTVELELLGVGVTMAVVIIVGVLEKNDVGRFVEKSVVVAANVVGVKVDVTVAEPVCEKTNGLNVVAMEDDDKLEELEELLLVGTGVDEEPDPDTVPEVLAVSVGGEDALEVADEEGVGVDEDVGGTKLQRLSGPEASLSRTKAADASP